MYTNIDENTNRVSFEISPVIMGAIGLSKNEYAVLRAVVTFVQGRDVAKIARRAGLARTTTLYTLKKLKNRKLVDRVLHKKRYWWCYRRGLEFMIRGSHKEVVRENHRKESNLQLPL